MSGLSRLTKICAWWLAAACLTVSAGELKVGDAPAWVQWQERPLTVSGSANPSGLEYLFYDEQEHLGRGEEFKHFAYQIVTREGLAEGAQIKLSFDPDYQSIILHKIKVWRDGAARDYCDIKKFQIIQQEKELDRQIYNGRQTALCFLADIRVGDVVEVALTVSGRNPIYVRHYAEEFFVSWDSPVREQRLRVVPRDGQRLFWLWQGEQPAAVRAERRNGGELWWLTGPMSADTWEDNAPAWFAQHGYLQISDFPSWAEVVEWALPLYILPADGEQLKKQAAHLAQQSDNLESQAVAAVDFVQKEVRYLGMETGVGSHRPSPPEQTLARRFGDCKDKTLLLVALLRRLGVEAHPVLVNTEWREHLTALLPSPNAFDHAVTLIVMNGNSYVIDATDSYQAGNRLADRHMGIYGRGLVVRQGETGLAKFELGEHDRGGVEVAEQFIVSDYRAPAEFNVVSTFRGADADRNRELFAGESREIIDKNYREYYTSSYTGITTVKPAEMSDDTARNIVQVREYYRIDNFFAPTGKRKKLSAEVSTPYLHGHLPRVNAQERRSPLALDWPHTLSVTTRIEFPDDWEVNDDTDLNTPWFHYTSMERNEGRRVVVRRQRLTVKAEQVPVEQVANYLAKLDEMSDNSALQFNHHLTVSGAASNKAAAKINWPLTLTVALTFIISGTAIVGWLIYRLTRRPQPPPLPR